MLQHFLDGKKKYSAFIVTILAAIVPAVIQDPEVQKTFMDYIPTVAALLAGVFYIVTQGNIDKIKEEVKITNGQSSTTQAAQAVATQASTVAEKATAIIEAEPIPAPLNIKDFHEAVLVEVQTTYKETNPCTIFYKARDKGQVTDCQHISQAVDYWNYLVDLALDARDWLKEATEKKAGECGRSPEYYAFTRDFNTTISFANHLLELANSSIDWKSKVKGLNKTLYGIGTMSAELLSGGI